VNPAPDPAVAVVVLTYNGRDYTLDCLDSLTQVNWGALTLIVVDNGSHDGTADAVSERYPHVCVLRQGHNLGFAEGNNVGIRHSISLGVDYVFLLNNDTTVAADAIARCVELAESHADAGAVCPMIYFAHSPELIWSAGANFDPRRIHPGRMLGYRELDTGQFSPAHETTRAVGAAMLVPRSVLDEVGLLDAELFLQYEDTDWSLRIRRAGYRIYLEPEARIWHHVSAGTGGEYSPLIGYYSARNHVVICRRHAPLTKLPAFRREVGILAAHLIGARHARRRLSYVRAVLRGFTDGRRERLGPRPWRI
jgi:GT2 family glycosyltransferase